MGKYWFQRIIILNESDKKNNKKEIITSKIFKNSKTIAYWLKVDNLINQILNFKLITYI